MRRKPTFRTGATASAHRRRDVDIPAVPTFQPDVIVTQPSPLPNAEDDSADEAVRRMVEAAYT